MKEALHQIRVENSSYSQVRRLQKCCEDTINKLQAFGVKDP